MEYIDNPDPNYIKGFNDGYLMAKHEPALASKLSPAIENTIYGSGFKAGRKQLDLDNKKDRLPNWLKQDAPAKDNNIKGKELDKDSPDRE